MTADWPLSAAATALLADPRTPSLAVLRLSVRELVVSGAWRLERTAPPRRFRGRADGLTLRPGSAPVPDKPPLAVLDRALRRASPSGDRARTVVAAAVKAEEGLADGLRERARDELVRRRLLVVGRRLLRTRYELTPTGRAWATSPAQERARWRAELAAGRSAAVLATATAAATAAGTAVAAGTECRPPWVDAAPSARPDLGRAVTGGRGGSGRPAVRR